ncbi:MAG: DUF2585 family protein [Candidatus Peribacteraceae bacterium]|nr:DUF2585 family protein [Candidatus Peribacteraceae bacterium]
MKRSTLIIGAGAAAIMVVSGVILALMGRIPWCAGGFGLWTTDIASPCTSQLLADPYTFSHLLHGFLFFALLWLLLRRLPVRQRLLIALVLEAGWEILENTPFVIDRYRTQTAALGYEGDSILNSTGDMLAAAFGYYLAWKLPRWVSVLLVIAVELLMLWFFRDNLTLNILMLLYPLTAVKEWQLRG